MRPGLPVYLGRRWRSKQGDRLVLERWTARGGRRPVHFDDCPECVEGIEVGHGPQVAECLNLARFLIRAESGQMAAAYHADRFCQDVISRLPTTEPWSIDACTIRDYVNGEGPVLAHWGRADHWLPDPNTPQPDTSVTVPQLNLDDQEPFT